MMEFISLHHEARKIKWKGKQNDGQNFISSVRKLTSVYPMDNLFVESFATCCFFVPVTVP
jgi:hypothetical protein